MSLNKKVPKEVSTGESVVCLAPAMQATLPRNPLPAASPWVRFSFRRFKKVAFSKSLPSFRTAETGGFNDKNLATSLYRTSGEAAGDSQGGRVNYEAPLGSPLCLLSWRNKKVGFAAGDMFRTTDSLKSIVAKQCWTRALSRTSVNPSGRNQRFRPAPLQGSLGAVGKWGGRILRLAIARSG